MNPEFGIDYFTFLVVVLLILIILHWALSSKHKNFNPDDDFKMSPVLNSVLSLVMGLELIFLQLGLSFPSGGGSLLLLSRKP